MPYRVRYAESKRFGVIELSGALTWPDVEAAMRALFFHPAWRRASDVLWDCLPVTSTDIPPDDLPAIKAFMEESAAARSGGRSAVVVRGDTEAMLTALIVRLSPPSGRVIAPFREVEAALRFLDRDAIPDEMGGVAAG